MITQNNQIQNNTNTRGHQFTNKDGFDPSSLTFGFWNEKISLRMNPALPANKQSDTKIFDYEKTVMTSLTLKKAMCLYQSIKNKVIPAVENGTVTSTGVQVGGDTLIVIGTAKLTPESDPIQYISIHKSINPDTKIPELSISYEFQKVQTIDDYDAKTGKYDVGATVSSEFYLFVDLLKSSIMSMSNAIVHTIRTVGKYQNDKLMSTVESIANKVGASSGGYGKTSFGRKTSNVSWDSNDSSDTSHIAESEDIDSLDDINAFLN